MRSRRAGGRLLAAFLAAAPLISACASTGTSGAVPRPFPRAGGDRTPDSAVATVEFPELLTVPEAGAIITTAMDLRGTPYRNGGSGIDGFDCSGFTQYVFALHGVHLPREVRDQYAVGSPIDRRDVVPGDLVFFATTRNGPSHVGIAIGGDDFIHAPSSRGVVRVEGMASRYWSERIVGVRRIALR